ncbi:MAG: hypothetical protein M0P69_16475 [Bacteroidales bacterium]|jgi:hypothetical protein|nr:hypothetical protein [Bacteroidales bacterium]
MLKTITIKAFNRPELLRKTLQTLLLDKGCVGWEFCVSIDWSDVQDAVVRVVQEELSNRVSYHILRCNNWLGIAKNHVKALSFAFEGLKSNWNLDFDDDYIVHEGWCNLCDYYTDILMPVKKDIFSGHLQSLYPPVLVKNYQDAEELVRIETTYGHHGTLLHRERWESEYSQWLKKCVGKGDKSCEGITLNWVQAQGLKGVRPLVGRIEFQPNNGVNFTEALCIKSNSEMVYTDKYVPKDKFRVIETQW